MSVTIDHTSVMNLHTSAMTDHMSVTNDRTSVIADITSVKGSHTCVSKTRIHDDFFFFFAAQPSTIRCGTRLSASASGGTSFVMVDPAPT